MKGARTVTFFIQVSLPLVYFVAKRLMAIFLSRGDPRAGAQDRGVQRSQASLRSRRPVPLGLSTTFRDGS